jgi:uncharacterized protein (UPF0332 family)
MIAPEIKILLNRADESHKAAQVLLDKNFANFSTAQSYYTMFFLVEAILYSKGLRYSSHSTWSPRMEKSLQKPGFLTLNFTGISLLLKSDEKLVIMAGKTQSQLKKRLSHFDGRKSSCRH